MAVSQLVGAKIHRREDPRLVSGHGRYTDDLTRPALLHAAFVRSPFAHAKVRKIDITDAVKAPGVVAVYTARDFEGVILGPMGAAPGLVPDKKVPERFPLAKDETHYQGDPVAMVIADTKSQAADAAQMIEVDWEQLPAVHDLEAALKPDAAKAHSNLENNISWDLTMIPEDATAEAFKNAEVVVKERIYQQRLAPVPMEPRAILAEWNEFDGQLTVWMSTQNPHLIRLPLAMTLGLGEHKVRVVSHDVGGGFGSKIDPYPEDFLIAAAAKKLSRTVKWNETRTESMQNAYAGRGQYYDVEVAAKKDGTLLGLRVTQTLDVGGYAAGFCTFMAIALIVCGGGYKWPAISARTVGVFTNKTPTDAYRGAGRPEATHLVERIMDKLAAELGMDPVELRRKNFIQPNEFPFTQNFGFVIDSGNYEKAMDKALELADYKQLRQKQAELRKQGRYMGIGLSSWIELCGFGPAAAMAPATGGLGLTESSQIRFHPTGSVNVYVGTHSHGQGHDTTFAQLAADQLGVPYESVELHHGDTAEGPGFGFGTYGSRSLAVGGMAIYMSCQKIIEKAKKVAAHMLEAAEEDVEFDKGRFFVKGSPDKSKVIQEVAFASFGPLPAGLEQGLEATSYFDPPNLVWPFGTHICVLEVDPDTGSVDIQKYVAVDDCGPVINPMIVDGQLHGGVVQGLAQALFEEMVYDDSGQLRSATFLDYSMPTANEIPEMVLDKTVTPSPTNALGVKGIGEAGTIAASAAVINAICDALAPLGISHVDMPASPDRLWKQIQEAKR
jgi:aerobic carbon-monoxide dehydrogenase large subunit